MKKFFFFLLTAIVALSLGSCTKFQSAGPNSERFYVIKKIDGKVQYGVAISNDVQLFISVGKYCYGKLKVPESYICVPCKYDDITFTKVGEAMMFVCHKNKQMFLYGANGTSYANGNPITDVKFLGNGRGLCFNTKWEYKFYSPVGVYTTLIGPYEDVNVGFFGYSIKEKGKWGYVYGRKGITTSPCFQQTVPCQYDEIIEAISDNFNYNLALVRQGNSWYAYTNQGHIKKVNPAFIRYAKSIKDKNTSEPFFTMHYDRKAW